MRVSHLSIEPTSTSVRFILSGVYPRGSVSSSIKSLVISFDFSDLFKRNCKEDDDFEEWSMHDLRQGPDGKMTGRCFLGRRMSFSRRKADALCIVGKEFVEQNPKVEVCECTDSDFEWYIKIRILILVILISGKTTKATVNCLRLIQSNLSLAVLPILDQMVIVRSACHNVLVESIERRPLTGIAINSTRRLDTVQFFKLQGISFSLILLGSFLRH